MQGPWRYHIADFMMLFIGELWSRVQWRFPPGEHAVMVPVIVNVREQPEEENA